MPVGAAIGGILAGWGVDILGRKSALLVSAILHLIGWLLLITANLWSITAGFITVLLMGRFFTGCGLGWGMLCAPVSEISWC